MRTRIRLVCRQKRVGRHLKLARVVEVIAKAPADPGELNAADSPMLIEPGSCSAGVRSCGVGASLHDHPGWAGGACTSGGAPCHQPDAGRLPQRTCSCRAGTSRRWPGLRRRLTAVGCPRRASSRHGATDNPASHRIEKNGRRRSRDGRGEAGGAALAERGTMKLFRHWDLRPTPRRSVVATAISTLVIGGIQVVSGRRRRLPAN